MKRSERKKVVKDNPVGNYPFGAAQCEFCKWGPKKGKKLYDYVDKKGRHRASCKRHLKKV